MLLLRIIIEDQRLRERDQESPERTLERARGDLCFERLRRPAQQREHGKTSNGRQEQPLATEHGAEPPGRWQHDRTDHDIRRHRPGDLVLRRRERTLHVRQRHSSDRPVDRIDHAGQNRRRRDHGPVAYGHVTCCHCRRHGLTYPPAPALPPTWPTLKPRSPAYQGDRHPASGDRPPAPPRRRTSGRARV